MHIMHADVCTYTATFFHFVSTLCHTGIAMRFHTKACQVFIFNAESLEKYLAVLVSLNVL